MRLQFTRFNKTLLEIPEVEGLDSHGILSVLDQKQGLFKGIERVLSFLANATICLGGVEAVCESVVSVMEAHTPSVSLSNKLKLNPPFHDKS